MMHRFLLTLSLCVCLLGISAASEAQTIKNGDFEQGGTPWKWRNGWSWDCEHARTGRCSAQYQTNRGKNTPIAWQDFRIDSAGYCELTVWIRTELEDPPFWSDGEPTRTGVSVQLWNRTGKGRRVPLDLARQNVYRKGYRGQGGEQGWTKYVGRLSMAPGPWKATFYVHAMRTWVDGRLEKLPMPKGGSGWTILS